MVDYLLTVRISLKIMSHNKNNTCCTCVIDIHCPSVNNIIKLHFERKL